MQRDQIERRRDRRAVVGRVRDQLEMRKLAVAHLVHYLAGFGVAVVVHFFCLMGAEDLQCSARKLRIYESVLQRDDQAVATERGQEPRKPGGRQEDHVIRVCNRQAEGSQILERLAKKTIELLIAGPNLDDVFQPVRQGLGMVRIMALRNALARRSKTPIPVRQSIEKAAMPFLA